VQIHNPALIGLAYQDQLSLDLM